MFDYKVVLAGIAIVIGLAGYVPYLRDVLRRTTKPHIFSWIVWGLLEAIAFFAQLVKGGGAGAWATAASAVVAIFITIMAFRNSDKQIRPLDWLAFGGALIGVALWAATDNPLLAVICVAIADALGFVPTFRKAFYKPYEETLIEYALSALKWIITIPALGALNLTTWLYPASLIVTNSVFVTMVLVRRKTKLSAP